MDKKEQYTEPVYAYFICRFIHISRYLVFQSKLAPLIGGEASNQRFILQNLLSFVLSISFEEPFNNVEIENYGSYTFCGSDAQRVLVSC